MPLTIREAVATDRAAVVTLLTTKVSGTSIRDELLADFGSVIPFTLTALQAILNDPDARVVLGFQPAATLRGITYWHRELNVWHLKLIGVDKTLTDAQRIAGFHDFVIEGAARVPAGTRFAGVVKAGGKLDTYMQPRLPQRTVRDDGVLYETTAEEMLRVL